MACRWVLALILLATWLPVGCATNKTLDPGRREAGAGDAATLDGAAGDASADGASPVDSAVPVDAPGTPDGAAPDAGSPDAGPRDSGPPPRDAAACAEGETRSCRASCGSTGTQRCAGGAFGACMPPAETCNGIDDDCDGSRDNGFACTLGQTGSCSASCGSTGTRSCSTSCTWGTCIPPPESCNGVDDDCDGTVDNGAPCPAGEGCIGGRCERTEWVFEAEGPGMGHDVGRAEADGWSASTGPDSSGYMVFGPYTRDIPAGSFQAIFRLMVDNRDADNGVVVTLEVNDFDGGGGSCGSCVIASRQIRRMEFTGTYAYQDFAVSFTGPGASHRLELRTRWTDISYVREDRITVRRLP